MTTLNKYFIFRLKQRTENRASYYSNFSSQQQSTEDCGRLQFHLWVQTRKNGRSYPPSWNENSWPTRTDPIQGQRMLVISVQLRQGLRFDDKCPGTPFPRRQKSTNEHACSQGNATASVRYTKTNSTMHQLTQQVNIQVTIYICAKPHTDFSQICSTSPNVKFR